MPILRCLAVAGLTLCSCSAFSQPAQCTNADAQRAEAEAATFRSWNHLYKSYTLYRQCDDGAIGEGYSESVARILVDSWMTLPQLAHLAKKNADFRRFVLKHIDETIAGSDAKKIRANAKSRCPSGLDQLCNDLRKQTE
jgi:hypothetical protein